MEISIGADAHKGLADIESPDRLVEFNGADRPHMSFALMMPLVSEDSGCASGGSFSCDLSAM